MVNTFNELALAIPGLMILCWLIFVIPFDCKYVPGNRKKIHFIDAVCRIGSFSAILGSWLYSMKYGNGAGMNFKLIVMLSVFAISFLGLVVIWLYIPLPRMLKMNANNQEFVRLVKSRSFCMVLLLCLFGIPFSNIVFM